MVRPILTAARTRDAEARAIAGGIAETTLMERAGAALAEAVGLYIGPRPTLILCGPGNNGGDGYVAARHLAQRGYDIRVAALTDASQNAAKWAAAQWQGKVDEQRVPAPPGSRNSRHAIDMALDDVAAKAVARTHGALEVHPLAGGPRADVRDREGRHDRGRGEGARRGVANGETDAVDRDALSRTQVVVPAPDAQLAPRFRTRDAIDGADVVNESCEHLQLRNRVGGHDVRAEPPAVEHRQLFQPRERCR